MGIKFYKGPPYEYKKEERCHNKPVNQIKYNIDGTLLVSVGNDCKIVLIDGEDSIVCERENAHELSILGVDWIDKGTFVTASADCTLRIWNDKI